MCTDQSTQPFRFLDLPAEIRNGVYGLLLCSWDDETEQDSGLISRLSRRCPSYAAGGLLRANKQIHAEASDYMIKRNQFVRITCRGLDARELFLGADIPVITTDIKKASQFRGYVMHMTLFKPAFAPSAFRFSEFEIMMLRADLPRLCEQLDTESVMADANPSTDEHVSIHAEIKLDYAYVRFFTRRVQEHLFSPIATFLRGIQNVKIAGPVDPALAQAVSNEVAKPRWTDAEATLEEIGTGVDVGKRQWQQNNYYTAAESWAYALRTLERMRRSSSWLGLKEAGGEEFVNKTADLYFTLNLLHAQFLQVDMASEQASTSLIHRNGNNAILHIRRCRTASARFAHHAGATWIPSNQQFAKVLFLHAKCLRLMQDTAGRIRAVTYIEEAARRVPNDIAIRDEKDAVLNWNSQIEESQRSMEQSIAKDTERPSWIWSSIWIAVTELAA